MIISEMKTKPGGAEDQINTAENALVGQEDEKKSKKKKNTHLTEKK